VTKDKLQKIAQQKGEPCTILIPRLLEEHGTPFRVAVVLGVYPNTIRHWLLKNGYQSINRKWIKTTTDTHPKENIPDDEHRRG
jgi:hypothetical protein